MSFFRKSSKKSKKSSGASTEDKIQRSRSFSSKDSTIKANYVEVFPTSVDDSELHVKSKGSKRQVRRRTTGGSDMETDVRQAKQLNNKGDRQMGSQGTLDRQQIIQMVRERFMTDYNKNETKIPKSDQTAAPAPTSPTQKRYNELLLTNPASYPTLPRKEEKKEEVTVVTSAPAPSPPTTVSSGQIFLQCGGEVRKVVVPEHVDNVSEVKTLFEQAFPGCMGGRAKTIYVKDPACGIFFELEDVKDLSNLSHLKIHDPIVRGNTLPRSPMTSTPKHAPVPLDQVIHTTELTHTFPRSTGMKTIETRRSSDPEDVMLKKKVFLPGLGMKPRLTHGSPKSPQRMRNIDVEKELDDLTIMMKETMKDSDIDHVHVNGVKGSGSSSSEVDTVFFSPTRKSVDSPTRERMRSDSGHESPESSPTEFIRRPPPPPARSSSKTFATTTSSSSVPPRPDPPRPDPPRPQSPIVHQGTTTIQRSLTSPSKVISSSKITVSNSSPTRLVPGSPKTKSYTEHRIIKKDVKSMAEDLKMNCYSLRSQLNMMRQFQEQQSKMFQQMLEATGNQILAAAGSIKIGGENKVKLQRRRVDAEHLGYKSRRNLADKKLSDLESHIEGIRCDVVQKRCRVEPMELDALNDHLQEISHSVAELKAVFASLQETLKVVIGAELQAIFLEEKFLEDEPERLDIMFNRCKQVTGTLFTLQKLATVQEHMTTKVPNIATDPYYNDMTVFEEVRSIRPDHQARVDSIEDHKAKSRQMRVRFNDQVNHGR